MFTRPKVFSNWLFLSLIAIPTVAVIILFVRQYILLGWFGANTAKTEQNLTDKTSSLPPVGTMSKFSIQSADRQLSYEQWLTVLKKEAEAAAWENPQHLRILAGDSLSMWFPADLLPPEQTWLNQGIAGDTSAGLLQRLKLFDHTQPEFIFIMIGINDIIRKETDQTILENYKQIIRYLQSVHPNTQIVLQSILPDRIGGSNNQIRQLNQQLKAIAIEAGIYYYDLYPLFADAEGNLRPELTTDGLHLSKAGYLVWRSALQQYSNSKL